LELRAPLARHGVSIPHGSRAVGTDQPWFRRDVGIQAG
jgi:hypothetical protein